MNIELVLELVSHINSAFPDFGPTVTMAFNLVAVAGIALLVNPGFISFKGGRIRIFGKFVKDWQAAVGVLLLLTTIVFHETWIGLIYELAILNGQGALGVIILEIPVIVLAKTHRKLNWFWVSMILIGSGIIVISFM